MSISKSDLVSLIASETSTIGIDSLISTKREAPNAKLLHPEVGVVHTPLTRAIIHLLKIGSTSQQELQEMAREFITEKDACEKFNLIRSQNEK